MRQRQANLQAYLFLTPWLLGFFGLAIGPILGSLYLAMTRYNLLTPPRWTGFANIVTMFGSDSSFYHSLAITFEYVVASVPLRLVFALIVAMILNRGMRGIGIYRTVYYIPSLLGGSVAIAQVWKMMFSRQGLFNHLIAGFGIKGPDWISHPDYIMYTLITLSVWQFGSSMVIFLAGLKQIPGEIYEASSMDGARGGRRFYSITLPLITPVVFFNLVMNIISSFQVFTPGYIIGDGRGGPLNSTLFYSLYLYMKGFSFFQMGYASALAWVMLIIIATLTAIVFSTSRRWVYYGDER
jgi:multiple sugar transport system permease protein